LFVLRRTRPDAVRPYKAFGYPVLPAMYIVMAAWICVVLLRYKPQYTWPGLILVLLGVPVYLVWNRLRSSKGWLKKCLRRRRRRMANLFAKKSMNVLMAEAKEQGEHTLERSLGPVFS
jgi:hypothetical protein